VWPSVRRDTGRNNKYGHSNVKTNRVSSSPGWYFNQLIIIIIIIISSPWFVVPGFSVPVTRQGTLTSWLRSRTSPLRCQNRPVHPLSHSCRPVPSGSPRHAAAGFNFHRPLIAPHTHAHTLPNRVRCRRNAIRLNDSLRCVHFSEEHRAVVGVHRTRFWLVDVFFFIRFLLNV